MNTVKRFFSLMVALCCLLSILGCASIGKYENESSVSDVSDALQSEKNFGKLTVIFTGNVGGAWVKEQEKIPVSAVTGLKKSIEAKGEDVILLDTGGSLWGTDFAQADSGKSVIKLLNKMGYTAMAATSEDFNLDIEQLSYLSDSEDMAIMSSNCIIKATNKPFSDGGILIDKAGAKIGILALSPIETQNEVNPLNISGAIFEDDTVIIQTMVDNLIKNGADCIIVLTSLEKEHELNPQSLAEKIKGIDVVIGRGQVNPSISFDNFGGTVVVYSDCTMKSVGMVELDLRDKTSGIKSFTYDNENLRSLCDSDTETYIDELLNEQETLMNETICEIESDREYDYNENGEVPFGTAVAGSMRPITGAQCAFLKWSTIKSFPENGNISKKNILEIIDPKAVVVTRSLNGAEILSCLEESFENFPKYSSDFLIFSGINLQFKAQNEKGEKIENVIINGEKLSLQKEYKIALDSNLLSSDSIYSIFKNTTAENSYGLLNESVYRYFNALNKDGKLLLKECSAISLSEKDEDGDETVYSQKLKEEKPKGISEEEKTKEEPLEEAPVEKIKTYSVQLGDSLVKISTKLYGTSAFWEDILELNSDIIKNPNSIKVGMKLKLPK